MYTWHFCIHVVRRLKPEFECPFSEKSLEHLELAVSSHQVSAFSCYASMHAALEPISVHLLTQEWTKDGNQQSLSKLKSPVSFLQPKEYQRAMFVYACKNCCECLDPLAIIKSRALHSCKKVP